MSGVFAAVALAVAIGLAIPRLADRVRSPFSPAPRLGLVTWTALLVSWMTAMVVAGLSASVPLLSRVGGIRELMHRCPAFLAAVISHPAALAAALSGLGLSGWLLVRVAQSGYREHAAMVCSRVEQEVLLCGVQRDARGFAVVAAERPAAWSSAGSRGSIVVTTAAVALLSPDQLDAVVAHERAHIHGGHHELIAFARAVHRAVPCRFTEHALVEIAALAEMRADDVAAAASRSNASVASALLALSATVPPGALAAGAGGHPQLRLQRLLLPTCLPWWSRAATLMVGMSALSAPALIALAGFAPIVWLHFCPFPA